jgi:hypothetical protein
MAGLLVRRPQVKHFGLILPPYPVMDTSPVAVAQLHYFFTLKLRMPQGQWVLLVSIGAIPLGVDIETPKRG